MNTIFKRYSKTFLLWITIIIVVCLAAIVSMISAAQEVEVSALFKDKIILNGGEVTPEKSLLEVNGNTYIAAGDLAELFDVSWYADDSNGLVHIGANPSDEGEGEIINLGPDDFYHQALWASITRPDDWGTSRVNRIHYENTFERWAWQSNSKPIQASYRLDKKYEWFSVMLGVADTTAIENNEPVFQIIGDREVLFEARLRPGEPIKRVFLDVSDFTFLSYRVRADIDGSSNRYAIINPRLKKKHEDDYIVEEKPRPLLDTDVLGAIEGYYFDHSRPLNEPPSIVTDFGTFEAVSYLYSVYKDGWEGKLVDANRGDTLYDHKQEDMPGNICFLERGFTANIRMLYAQEAGAIGAIYYNNLAGMISNPSLYLDLRGMLDLPVVGISRDDGREILAKLAEGDIHVRVEYGPNAEGHLVNCGTGDSTADFPSEAAGGLVLVHAPVGSNLLRKVANAQYAGASGVVFYNEEEDFDTPPEVSWMNFHIPIIGISKGYADSIIAELDAGEEVYAVFVDAEQP